MIIVNIYNKLIMFDKKSLKKSYTLLAICRICDASSVCLYM